jgi:signal transduction histidine kinase
MLIRQIVHDLRNATQAMSLVVEDMELSIEGDNPELRAGLQTIDSQITFITNFLKEKLNWFQRGEKGALQEATALPAIFVELENRFGPAARAKHQRLVVSLPPSVQVPLTGVQLAQIVGNLLDNAIKYTQVLGEVRLWADVSDGWVTLYVADNGPGVTAADRPRLGEIGYRGRKEQEGSGLGLANVRQMVTQAGGLFGVSGSEAQGTTFHVSLPTTTWGRITL